jgi:hypothetical protein
VRIRIERVRVVEQPADLGIRLGLGLGLGQARDRATGEATFRLLEQRGHPVRGPAEPRDELLLQRPRAQVRGDRVEAAGGHDPGAGRARPLVVAIDHPAHPLHLAVDIAVVRAGLGARGDQLAAEPGVRAHRGAHDLRAARERVERRPVVRVGDEDLHPEVERLEPAAVAAGDRPPPPVVGVREVLGDQPAGEAAGAEQDEIEFAGGGHRIIGGPRRRDGAARPCPARCHLRRRASTPRPAVRFPARRSAHDHPAAHAHMPRQPSEAAGAPEQPGPGVDPAAAAATARAGALTGGRSRSGASSASP